MNAVVGSGSSKQHVRIRDRPAIPGSGSGKSIAISKESSPGMSTERNKMLHVRVILKIETMNFIRFSLTRL
jgi:hypothetical protein